MVRKALAAGLLLSACALLWGCESNGKEKLEVFSTKMENRDILQKFADEYTELHPEVEIDFQSPPEGSTVLRTKLTKNRVPDVIFMGGDAVYKDLAGAGVLMDVSDMDIVDTIQPAYKQQLYDRNKDQEEVMYGLPYATNAEGIIYNKEIFQAHGLEIPKTYEELIGICESLKADGVQPFYYTFKDAWTLGPLFMPLSANLAPETFLQDRQENKTTFLETHREVGEKILELREYGQKDFMGKSYDDGNIAFANGEAAMYPQGNWAIPNIQKANPGISLDMFTFPAGSSYEENNVVSGIDVMAVISVDTDKEALAKDFIEFVFQEENMKAYMEDQFAFSAVLGYTQEADSVQGLKETFAEGKIVGFPDHFYPTGYDYAVDVQAFIGRGKDIDGFLKEMDEHYDKYNAMQ